MYNTAALNLKSVIFFLFAHFSMLSLNKITKQVYSEWHLLLKAFFSSRHIFFYINKPERELFPAVVHTFFFVIHEFKLTLCSAVNFKILISRQQFVLIVTLSFSAFNNEKFNLVASM